jgi:hypothetical protein
MPGPISDSYPGPADDTPMFHRGATPPARSSVPAATTKATTTTRGRAFMPSISTSAAAQGFRHPVDHGCQATRYETGPQPQIRRAGTHNSRWGS